MDVLSAWISRYSSTFRLMPILLVGATISEERNALLRENLRKRSAASDELEKDIASVVPYVRVIAAVSTWLLCPVIARRKIAILLCIGIKFVHYSAFVAGSFFYNSVASIYWFTLPARGLTGGLSAFAAVLSATVIDLSRDTLRKPQAGIPLTFGFMSGVTLTGFTTGTYLASFLLTAPNDDHPEDHWQTYFYLGLANLVGIFLTFVYAAVFFEETNVKAEVGDNNQSSASKGIFRKYGLASFRVLAKQRPGWIRLCLALTLCAMLVEQIYVGAGAVGLPVVLRFINLRGKESIAAIVAAVSSGLVCIFIAFANATWQLFAASSLFLPAGVFVPASHTIVAKMVDSDEMGALFALKSMLLLGFSLVEKFILSKIYAVLCPNNLG